MAAEINQDFVTYQGDDVSPIFTVRDSAGQPVDISTVSDIQWAAKRNADSSAVLSKTKLAGQITFVTTGVDGKFQVAILKTDTALLDDYYLHQAKIVDSVGNVTTVTVGRMQVGIPPAWTYVPSDAISTAIYGVRRMVGDVITSDPQLSDPEIAFALSLRGDDLYGAAAECCRFIASQYARKVDMTTPGELRTAFSQQTKNYNAMAAEWDKRSTISGGAGLPYAGGISIADKMARIADTDRVPPQFNIGMDDNYIPLPAVAQEQQTYPLSGVPNG